MRGAVFQEYTMSMNKQDSVKHAQRIAGISIVKRKGISEETGEKAWGHSGEGPTSHMIILIILRASH